MERTLILVRHAKADDGPVDIRRSLSRRGERDAAALGDWLAGNGLAPTHVVVSPATRARQTWDAIAARLDGARPEVVVDDRIYDNDVDRLRAVVHDIAGEARTLALVGHNPSMHDFAVQLDDRAGDAQLRTALREAFPTSAIAVFGITTSAPQARAGRLLAYGVGRG